MHKHELSNVRAAVTDRNTYIVCLLLCAPRIVIFAWEYLPLNSKVANQEMMLCVVG